MIKKILISSLSLALISACHNQNINVRNLINKINIWKYNSFMGGLRNLGLWRDISVIIKLDVFISI